MTARVVGITILDPKTGERITVSMEGTVVEDKPLTAEYHQTRQLVAGDVGPLEIGKVKASGGAPPVRYS